MSKNSNLTWKNVPTQTVNVDGVPFVYRELGLKQVDLFGFSLTWHIAYQMPNSRFIQTLGTAVYSSTTSLLCLRY